MVAAFISSRMVMSNASYKLPEAVIKKADERMYYGKQHGKNILVFEDKD